MDAGTRRQAGRRAAVVAVAVVLVLAGAAAGRSGRPAGTRPPVATAGPGPSGRAGGVPVGYARTADGAVAAATTYLAALAGPTVFDPGSRRAALDAVALPAARAEVERVLRVDPAGAAAAGLTTALADGSLVARTIPAGSRLRSYSPDAAEVEVWAVSLFGTRTLAHAGASWSTTTVSLRWYGGDWRLAGMTSRAGPVPSAGRDLPSRYDDLLAGLVGMEGYAYAPRR